MVVRNMNFGASTDIDVTDCSIRFKFKTWKGNKSMWLYTECGRKKSPIWEANKFKTKEDTANVFFYFWKVHRMPFYINVF